MVSRLPVSGLVYWGILVKGKKVNEIFGIQPYTASWTHNAKGPAKTAGPLQILSVLSGLAFGVA